MKYVVDASVLAKVYRREPGSAKAKSLIRTAVAHGHELLAPQLIVFEVGNALVKSRYRRDNRTLEYTHSNVVDCLERMTALVREKFLRIVETDADLLGKAADLARLDTGGQGHVSFFDAIYQALAEREGARFVTADARYVRKISGVARLRSSTLLLDDFIPPAA